MIIQFHRPNGKEKTKTHAHKRRLGHPRFMRAILSVAALVALPCWGAETTGRPKIYGIAYVKVKVTDVQKAQAFYGGLLGMASNGSSCKGVANPCFVVNPYQHVELVQTSARDRGSYLAEIGLTTSDLQQMLRYLTARGVRASEILRRADGRKYFDLEDPEGNHLAFVETSGDDAEIQRAGQISNRMFHAGFVVKDLKAESRFYEDILGFRLYWRGGFKDDGTDWYEIQVPDGDNWIEFMLNIPATADHKELGVQNHFSLGVVNARVAAEKLRAKGAKEFDGPEVGRDGKNALDIYDPDWTRVELMEFTPVQKPCCAEYTGPHPKP
jgi:catechol 2,3-dioxygenase-like lactoylglutathione lyase family enzyme